jgi:methionyl-tRNA synthetase
MPKACQLLWTSLGAESALGPLSTQRIAAVADVHLPAGAVVTKLAPLFPRLEEQPTVVPA